MTEASHAKPSGKLTLERLQKKRRGESFSGVQGRNRQRSVHTLSQSLWRCRNRTCGVPHGAVLGRVTADGGLVLQFEAATFVAHLNTKRVYARGGVREFRGNVLYSPARTSPNTQIGQEEASGNKSQR
jgi:hypothetical protein